MTSSRATSPQRFRISSERGRSMWPAGIRDSWSNVFCIQCEGEGERKKQTGRESNASTLRHATPIEKERKSGREGKSELKKCTPKSASMSHILLYSRFSLLTMYKTDVYQAYTWPDSSCRGATSSNNVYWSVNTPLGISDAVSVDVATHIASESRGTQDAGQATGRHVRSGPCRRCKERDLSFCLFFFYVEEKERTQPRSFPTRPGVAIGTRDIIGLRVFQDARERALSTYLLERDAKDVRNIAL